MGILYIRNKDGNLIPLQSSTSCDSIKTINGIKPDENGNIEIIIPDIPSSNEKSDEVYILGKNETLSDVPDGITVVIDPDGNPDFDLSKYVKTSELNSVINTALTSYAKTEDIPTDSYINSLIDTKLAQFSNAEGVSF